MRRISTSKKQSSYAISGFTLLEVLVAMAVFAFLAVASYSSLNIMLKTRDKTDQAAKSLQRLQMSMTIMQRDLMQLVNTPITDEFGDRLPPIFTPTNNSSLLEFTRSGWRNPASQLRSNFQRVAYALEDNTLYRHHWRRLHRASQEEPIKAVLLRDIEEVEFEFLGEDKNRWLADWPPMTLSGDPGIPVATRVTITFSDDSEAIRIFGVNQ